MSNHVRIRLLRAAASALGFLLVVVWVGVHLRPAAAERNASLQQPPTPPAKSPTIEIAGAWAGTLTHEGETQDLAIELEPSPDGAVLVRVTIPVVHVARTPMARAVPKVNGQDVTIGPFTFHYDDATRTLSGTLPEALVPVYRVPFALHRVERVVAPVRAAETVPIAKPAWTFDAGAPCWAGVTWRDDTVFAGCEDGQLHAIDARTARERWSFRASAPVRTRATLGGNTLYFQADDGFLYAVDAATGTQRWRSRVVEKPIERLPFDNPKSRFDRFASDVVAADGRLYLGTHDGKVLALATADGRRLWEFATGDSVLGAPAVAGGRVYAGSFDKYVYALDAATGQLIWKRDTLGSVVSTPAVDDGRLIIGNRAYDLLGLDVRDGSVAWKRYVWFSWVESSATVREGVAYVGSSDAAIVLALDAKTGRPIWKTDVRGWAWGQPAVTGTRVYVGTSSQPGYLGGTHVGGAVALDRKTGHPVWRVALAPGNAGPYGFPGSPAVGGGLVFFAGLDGKIYAFAE